MSKTKLAILVPTRGRPHNLERLAKAVRETCTGEYQIFARLDNDDQHHYPEIDGVRYVKGPRIFFAASMNELAQMADSEGYTHLALLGDDVLPETVGWDETLINSIPEIGVAYGSDGLEKLHGEDLPTHVIVPTEMYRRLGWIALPDLRHLFCDNVWRELGKMTSFVYHRKVKLTHLHRWNKKAPNDNTYREANDRAKRDADKASFEAWRNGDGLIQARKALLGE